MHIPISTTVRSQPPLVHLAILVISLAPLYFLSYRYRMQYPYGASTNPKHINVFPPSSPVFDKKWLETRVVAPFNPAALQRYCNQTSITWHKNLAFHLPDANGGVGNVKGSILDFIFYAIEAGATELMLPSMASRSQEDLINVWAGRQPFSTFFDETWFMERMAEACPQMRVVPEKEEMVVESIWTPSKRRTDGNVDETREHFVGELGEWIQSTTGRALEEHGEDEQVVVSMERTLWEFDTCGLPWNVRRELGQVLSIREDLRAFAAEVVRNLGSEYGLDVDASEVVPTRRGGRFLGGHLRTESDAIIANFNEPGTTDSEIQTNAIIQEALKHNLTTLYIATGSAEALTLFKHQASLLRPPLNVTSKFDLLSASSASVLRRMTWDQQALVDFEVMQRCTFFVGLSRSSFSFQVAMTRNQWLMDQGRVSDPYEVTVREDNVAFEDQVSRITGPGDWFVVRIPRGMWP